MRAKLLFVAILLLGLVIAVWRPGMRSEQNQQQDWEMEYVPAPVDNPLKGFFPYRGDHGTNFPHSMEWDRFALNKLVTGEGVYDFAPLEEALGDVASRGHQLVMRVYLDYPTLESGVPKYLVEGGLEIRDYEAHGGGSSPNYDDERLVAALEAFVFEFGKRYDGDPRLGFITVGLLGMWGEWHTFPHEDWFAGEETQKRVLKAYTAAFENTKLLVRRPAGGSPMLPIGYHDDSFAFSTLPTIDWHFVSQLRSSAVTNHWRRLPVGGEIRPEIQKAIWQDPVPTEVKTEDFDECVKQTHCSWLLAHELFVNRLPAADHERAVTGAWSLGYELHVASVRVATTNAGVAITLSIENRGVAPFYYDWPVVLMVRDEAGNETSHATPWQLTGILPGEPVEWSIVVEGDFASGSHELKIKVQQPMKKGVPFRFANRQSHTESSLTLGAIQLAD